MTARLADYRLQPDEDADAELRHERVGDWLDRCPVNLPASVCDRIRDLIEQEVIEQGMDV